ncbi:hypothetical protein [Microtetraspora malaysiensis]|uniref:Uncharacterized protein n=1 Tax=Microtetraspora malaysiensis TaxID=161358 RepID=A0ABW6SKS3_9ACTN
MLSPGPNVTITGSGSGADPYVISAAAGSANCDDIRACVCQSAGPGLECGADNKLRVKISGSPGNTVMLDADGGVYGAGGSGGGGLEFVSTQGGSCIGLGGQGTPGSPLTAAPIVDGGDGNLLQCTPNGMRAALAVGGCGLTGDGSPAAPLKLGTGAWSYPCPPTSGEAITCDENGVLRGSPRSGVYFVQDTFTREYANLAVPADTPGAPKLIETRTLDIRNRGSCRVAHVIGEHEVDVQFDLPAGATASYGIQTDAMWFVRNSGPGTTFGTHVQTTKVFDVGTIPPATTITDQLEIRMGRGTGGATYTRIQTFMRYWIFAIL